MLRMGTAKYRPGTGRYRRHHPPAQEEDFSLREARKSLSRGRRGGLNRLAGKSAGSAPLLCFRTP